MNSSLKLILILALLLGLGAVVYVMLDLGGTPGYLPEDRSPPKRPKQAEKVDPGIKTGKAFENKPDRKPVAPETHRVEVTDDDLSGKSYPQGIEGSLVDPSGYPVANAQVYLMPALGVKHAFELMRQHAEGRIFLPVAQTTSNESGQFRLGIERIEEGKTYEIKITHDKFCDKTLPNITPKEGEYYRHPPIKLKRGVVVEGHVLAKGTNYPVAEATVSIGNPNGTIDIAPVPGREHGITKEVDASGYYRIENVDPGGYFKMTALAPDYAKEEKTQITLQKDTINRVDFQLSPGFSIAGIVTGPTGKPVPYAKVTAYCLSQKNMQSEETRSGEDGKFEVLGLQQGSYTIVAESPGFVKGEDKPIPAGKEDVHIVLEQQGQVTVQVFSKTGGPMRSYQVWLKTYFEGQEIFGNTNVYRKVERSRDGTTTLEGIDPMDYVVEVQAKGHAKGFSEPFKITTSQQEVPKVVVRLNEGGVIEGVLVNQAGQPIVGALVSTRPNKLIDNPLVEMFQVPYRITKTSVKTDDKGSFRINLLNDGLYQLRYEHSDYCTLTTNDTKVITGETTNVGQVRMVTGVLLTGVVRVNGVPMGQIKVQVSSVADENNPSPMPFSCDAITDNQGRYILSKRLPPGSYEAYAAQQIQNNPFLMIVQMQKSKKPFRVTGNRRTRILDINLTQ